ncbi:ABC1 kinase family protein [Capillimicrobium parvum]|uniref:Protein kinase UbiB n=1 Tax=Capillimicrobium parvum TaxID=2884022 RepID=A0A9E6XX87_9ACTN|nr:AarF/UbiB family protein [Capillimicrobium parvum]UGS35768.1 protein kinase UbiB [Capillimicrobium parvum]
MTVYRRVASLGSDSARLAHTVRALSRYGLTSRLRGHGPAWLQRHMTDPQSDLVGGRSEGDRLRLALQELGPIYVKLGQLLSVSGVLPPTLQDCLAQLQEHAEAQDAAVIRGVVELELGHPVDELFADFEERPIGVASIAQVHAARLPDGTDVAVKVQHDGIEATVHEDLDIITALAGVVEDHVPEARAYRPRELAQQFRRRTLGELDFRREAANAERFGEAFHDEPDVHFARPVPELSGRRVMTLELLHGSSLADVAAADGGALDRPAFGRRCAEVWMTMIFRDGFVHADPHPGNIFVLPGGRIGVIDCGMVMRVDHETRAGLAAIGSALASGRADELTETLLAVCDHPAEVDHEAFAEEVERAVLARVGAAGPIDMRAVLGDMRSVVRAYGLEIPGKLDLLAQVAAELEGTVRHVDADFRMTPVLHSVVRRLAEQRLRPEALLERGEDVLRHLATGRRHMLRDVRTFVERIGSGRFEVVVRHTDADEAVDRLTYGMLTAALLVGAPIVWHADPPPRRNGVSVPGAALTGAGVLMAAGLLRGGRRRRAKPPA